MVNKFSAELPEVDQESISTSLTDVEAKLSFLISLSAVEAQKLIKMGSKSMDFVHDALLSAREHPEILPTSFDLAEYENDVALYDALQSIQIRINELAKKIDDTMRLVGSDSMNAALEVYGLLNLALKTNPSLKPTIDELKKRFAKSSK